MRFPFFSFRKSRKNRQLEQLAREHTAELEKLRGEFEAALEAVKSANRSKSAFLANMSHEIRTDMNSVIGFSELALDGEVSLKTKEYLEKIRVCAEWMLHDVNNMLDISKIESGKIELEKIPFTLHELLESCRTLIAPKAAEKGILLHFYAEPPFGKRPLGDPAKLRQVFVNLLSNAVKFTNTGMVKFLSDVTETDEGITMTFEVKDSGIGMTKEQIKKIEEIGQTLDGSAGLGLAITKNIIEAMGGKLSIESTPAVGSKFSFSINFDTIEMTDDETLDQKIVINELEAPSFEGEILLCEDNGMNQEIVCENLEKIGFKTVVASNGKIGVDIINRRRENGEKQVDLVFMDIHMPVMDGLEASAKILELDANIPVVAMTANIMTEDMEIYKRSGMNDCVGKPFTSQELWHCLMKYFTPLDRGIRQNFSKTEKEIS